MKINPEKKEDLKLDVKGFGCWNDCNVYYANDTSTYGCGWKPTPHNSWFS
ncbi:hypothetical protein [Paenibacillus sp. JZ16]|nr:hypothetical protein [Paenibacillus sp. JZ16]